MRFKKTRIAVSVCCGILCLLLIGLWVRSSCWIDQIGFTFSDQLKVGCAILPGTIGIGITDDDGVASSKWQHISMKVEDYTAALEETDTPTPIPSCLLGEFLYDNAFIAVPFWVLCVATVTMSAASWLPFHFSLRTLLGCITVVALALGLVIYLTRT